MSKNIGIQIDLLRLDKSRIEEKSYVNKAGETVNQKLYKLDVSELSPEKVRVIKEGDTWEFVESHFVFDQPTKEERAAETKMGFIGKGTQLRDKTQTQPEAPTATEEELEDPSIIPF